LVSIEDSNLTAELI